MLLRRLISRSGFSMTELMVGMGLLGGVSLVGMRLAQQNAQNDSYVRFKAEVSKATAIVQTHLSDNNSCKSMLVGKTRNQNYDSISMTNRLGTATVMVVQEGTFDGFVIPDNGIRLETSRLESGTNTVTDLVITFQIRGRSFMDRTSGRNETIVKRIPVKTEVSGSTIRSCGPVVADSNLDAKKLLCDSLGSKVATWTGTECNLIKFSCPYGQVPMQLTSLGAFGCVPVERQLNPTQIFDFSSDPCSAPGANVRLSAASDGRIRAVCD